MPLCTPAPVGVVRECPLQPYSRRPILIIYCHYCTNCRFTTSVQSSTKQAASGILVITQNLWVYIYRRGRRRAICPQALPKYYPEKDLK